MEISPQKITQNNSLSDSKKTPIQQNKINNNMLYNQLNRSEGVQKPMSSKNLGAIQFKNNQDKFNTLQPINTPKEFNYGNNIMYGYNKMNSSDNKIINMNINNSLQKQQYPGTELQPNSSKNLNPKALNFKNVQ